MVKNKDNNYENYAYCIKEYFNKNKSSICLITKDSSESKYLTNELSLIMNHDQIVHFPENDILPYDHFSIPERITKQRFKIVNQNIKHKHILISSIRNIFEKYPEKNFYKSLVNFSINSKISIQDIVEIVESLNYQKKSNVEKINQYSIRGGIIDIFTPIYKNPLRIEIFDDLIESIRLFDVESQLSITNIPSFSISNGNVVSMDDKTINLFVNKWRDYFIDKDERYCSLFQKIKNKELPEGFEIYFPLFFNKTANFFELFKNYKFFKINDLNYEINEFNNLIKERYKDGCSDDDRPLLKPSYLYTDIDKIKSFINQVDKADIKPIDKYFDSFKSIQKAIQDNEFNKNKLVLISSIPSEVEKLKQEYQDNISEIRSLDDIKSNLSIMFGDVIRPIHDLDRNVYIFHKENIDKTIYNVNINNEKLNQKITTHNYYEKNDLVVHEDYGIGIYSGLELIEANNKKSEYIKIIYLNNENLYVPLRDINKITNYHKTNNTVGFKLDSLSSTKWSSKKAIAKKRAADHAAEILDIESRRNNSNSFSLKADNQALSKFESEFPFVETPDQVNAFESIKKDLSLIKPMNRVLCGDVGFGKTEVAMRSAFISVYSNKQVVIITPSTILCDQHYNSFVKRFENFPITIEKLNRFNSLNNKASIMEDFNTNKIDILITTHIVFNHSMDFNKTGLLIIDEEHKFGIKQKNFIKDKQENIHILYLSATPIPRTMNLVFSGLKEFSFLQTPPSNRVSIKSFLKLHTSQLMKEALSREKIRNGQCFIVQNDISKMDSLKNEINKILPDFRIASIHGKLPKNIIKKIMNDFKNGHIDGLICTTIIEMGLDIPNANTMIIMNSHNFGLSQLHQLRGRVGRSEKQGYCYFLIPTLEIPKISRNRLDTVIKHSSLGEGFMIAQEDLEIRGGGEMLGEKQSGHVDNIGLSLYLSMLKDSIDNQRSNEPLHQYDCEINFYDSVYISDEYLPSPTERLKVYKRINSANSLEELNDVKKNIEDRCGKMPEETLNIIRNKKIIIRISNTGIRSIKSNDKNTNFLLSNNIKDKILKNFINLASLEPEKYSINKDNKFIYKSNELESNKRRKNVNLLLDEII